MPVRVEGRRRLRIDDYFVLYVRHELGADTPVDVPVAVTLGEAGTTTLAERCLQNFIEGSLLRARESVDELCLDAAIFDFQLVSRLQNSG